MKVALIGSSRGAALYTMATLRTAMHAFGIEEAGIVEADALWVSMCDVSEAPVLKRARRQAGRRPLIMGGFEGWMWRPWLAWADAVVVGEGWEFMEAWGRDPDEAMALPCVATTGGRSPVPSSLVRWDLAPLVCAPGHRRYLYLAARGCHRRCAFCLSGHCQRHQVNDEARLVEVARAVRARKSRLTWVTNDSRGLPPAPVDVHSVTAADYMDDPKAYKAGLVRIGIEGWTEACRAKLGKPLTDARLREVVQALKQWKQPAQLYLMADYPGWSYDMLPALMDAIGQDTGSIPPLFLKVTYFDPCPGTPMGDAAITGQWCDTMDMFARLGTHNHRVRLWGTRSRARSAWRAMMHRCTPEQAIDAPAEPKDTNTAESFDTWRAGLSDSMSHNLDGATSEWAKMRD